MVTAKQQIEVRPNPRSLPCHVGPIARRTSWLIVYWASPSLFRHVVQDSKYYPALSTVDSIRQQLSTAYDQPFIHRVKLWLPELSNQASKLPHPPFMSDATAIHHRVDSLSWRGWRVGVADQGGCAEGRGSVAGDDPGQLGGRGQGRAAKVHQLHDRTG